MVALKSDGTLMAWGNNRYGQLGDYTAGYPDANRSTPVQVAGVSGASAIAAGDGHSLAVVADTTVPTTPSVTSHTPTQTTGVPRNTKPTATFSKEMNETTINATNIKFQVYNKKKKKWISVARTVSYDSTSKTATVTPGSTLLASKKYRVTVTTNVKDTSGTALDQNSTTSGNQPATWTFTTGTS
jgi:alpha-tubulin suppressor-like RCC1 family protein